MDGTVEWDEKRVYCAILLKLGKSFGSGHMKVADKSIRLAETNYNTKK